MKRLQQKCFVASAGLHLLLVFTLLLGSAFQRPSDQPREPGPGKQGCAEPIHIVPVPEPAEAPAVALTQPAASARPNLLPPETPDLAPASHDRDSLTPAPKRRRTPRVNTNLVSRVVAAARPVSSAQPTATDSYADQVGRVADRISRMISPGTAIDLGSLAGSGIGAAGGGSAYAQVVKEYYSRSWDLRGVASEEGTVFVTVVIASDGRVASARITAPSSDAAVDASVQQALNRVRSLEPFESGAKEKQRTYTIHFNVRARRLLE